MLFSTMFCEVMFSVGKRNYRLLCSLYTIQIELYQLKTKTKIMSTSYYNAFYSMVYDNYIMLFRSPYSIYIYNGTLISMNCYNINFCSKNFKFDKSRHCVFTCDGKNIFVNDIRTGDNLVTKYMSIWESIVKQSPDRLHIYFHDCDAGINYIIPTETFINMLIKGFNIQILEKYKINMQSDQWEWATSNTIYRVYNVGDGHFRIRMQIFNIDNKNAINIAINDIYHDNIPYVVAGLYYIFLNRQILIIEGNNVNEIPNSKNIIHYNYKSNLFVADDCSVYILGQHNDDFIEFKFVGDYEQDYDLIPNNIKSIIESLLNCDIIYDVVNGIYQQLLKLDPIISLVY